MTEQRRVIARVLDAATDHPDVEELYRAAPRPSTRISISTVYRTVKLFEDAGIITRHEFRDGRARYEQIPDEHHDHLIDLRTGKVIEFRNEEIERLQERIARGARLQARRPSARALRRAARHKPTTRRPGSAAVLPSSAQRSCRTDAGERLYGWPGPPALTCYRTYHAP